MPSGRRPLPAMSAADRAGRANKTPDARRNVKGKAPFCDGAFFMSRGADINVRVEHPVPSRGVVEPEIFPGHSVGGAS